MTDADDECFWEIGSLSNEFDKFIEETAALEIQREVNRHLREAIPALIKDPHISWEERDDDESIISVSFANFEFCVDVDILRICREMSEGYPHSIRSASNTLRKALEILDKKEIKP